MLRRHLLYYEVEINLEFFSISNNSVILELLYALTYSMLLGYLRGCKG